jgi:hypothetical protein
MTDTLLMQGMKADQTLIFEEKAHVQRGALFPRFYADGGGRG